MPRNLMLIQLDDDLVAAKRALIFWRDQTLLADIGLRDCARAAVRAQEAHVDRLIEIQEALAGIGPATG